MNQLIHIATGWTRARLARLSDERGLSQTTEMVLLVIFTIAIVGIVTVAVQAYIQGKLGEIH